MNGGQNDNGPENAVAAVAARLSEIVVLGLPGTFTQWGLTLVRQILEAAGHVTELPAHPDPVPAVPGVVQIRFGQGHPPGGPDAPLPTILFIDEPEQALRELMASGLEVMDAVRALTAALAPLAPVMGAPRTLLIQRTPLLELASVQQAICAHLLPGHMRLAEQPAVEATALSRAPLRSGQALALARQTLAPLIDLVAGKPAGPIIFPLACFCSGNNIGEIAEPIIDIFGPRRALYYGPYFHLPAGRWIAEIQMLCLDNISTAELTVDVFSGSEVAKVALGHASAGLYQISLPFIIVNAAVAVEIRIVLERGAIEGQIGLRHITLTCMELGPQ